MGLCAFRQNESGWMDRWMEIDNELISKVILTSTIQSYLDNNNVCVPPSHITQKFYDQFHRIRAFRVDHKTEALYSLKCHKTQKQAKSF